MSTSKEFPRYNIISIRVNEVELEVINKLCDEMNISASKACRILMFEDTDKKLGLSNGGIVSHITSHNSILDDLSYKKVN